ncbi:MAG: hypothetical protein SGARI_000824 [Bacillariaceae sp.]
MEYHQNEYANILFRVFSGKQGSDMVQYVKCLRDHDIPSVWDNVVIWFDGHFVGGGIHFNNVAAFIGGIGIDGLLEVLRQYRARMPDAYAFSFFIATLSQRSVIEIDLRVFLYLTSSEFLPFTFGEIAKEMLNVLPKYEEQAANDQEALDALEKLFGRCVEEW